MVPGRASHSSSFHPRVVWPDHKVHCPQRFGSYRIADRLPAQHSAASRRSGQSTRLALPATSRRDHPGICERLSPWLLRHSPPSFRSSPPSGVNTVRDRFLPRRRRRQIYGLEGGLQVTDLLRVMEFRVGISVNCNRAQAMWLQRFSPACRHVDWKTLLSAPLVHHCQCRNKALTPISGHALHDHDEFDRHRHAFRVNHPRRAVALEKQDAGREIVAGDHVHRAATAHAVD